MVRALRQLIPGRGPGGRGLPALAPWLTLAAFLLPVAAGLAATVLPALGVHPGLSRQGFSLSPFAELFALPGIASSIRLSLTSGLAATALSLGLVAAVCAGLCHTRIYGRIQAWLTPMLAVPHSAAAIGLAFLLAPSGWLVRLAAGALGITRPPDAALIQDPWGASLTLALMVKAVPFLALMTLAAGVQVRERELLTVARSLGYRPAAAWLKVVLPRVYPLIRLPVFAVLAFSLSVVDVALVIGPSTPAPLAVAVFRLFNHKDLFMVLPGAAGACLLFLLVLGCIGLWRLAESVVARGARSRLVSGGRGRMLQRLVPVGLGLGGVLALCTMGALACLALWSVTGWWRFPSPWPEKLTLATWSRHLPHALDPALTTLAAGAGAVVLSLVLVIACLENEDRALMSRARASRTMLLLYLPLLVPQIAFLFGAQVLFIRFSLAGTWAGLVWSHLLFVLPYVFLSLAEPWRRLDKGYAKTAACLGAGPWQVLFRVKLALLLRPICVAAAIGFAVSAAEYLPTVFAGAGRFSTLTTEAVTLASGGDRRLGAAYGFMQAALPLMVYGVALAVPAVLHRRRAGMR